MRKFLVAVGLIAGALVPGGTSLDAAPPHRGSTKHVVSVAVDAPCVVARGDTPQLRAIATFDDATTADVTDTATWRTSSRRVVSLTNARHRRGRIAASRAGTVTVTASLGRERGSADIIVGSDVGFSLVVAPTNPSIAAGRTQQFSALLRYDSGCTESAPDRVLWSSSSQSAAVVSNAPGSKGLATGVGVGNSTISALLDGLQASATLTVTEAELDSIDVTPANPRVPVGLTWAFTATGRYSDGSRRDLTTQVTWSSSTSSVATVSNAAGSNGIATTVGAGSTTISATLGGLQASTTLTVPSATLIAIAITPENPSVGVGLLVPLTATGVYSDGSSFDLTTVATWSSNAPLVATVSNVSGWQGAVTGVTGGFAEISAVFGGVVGTTTVVVVQ